MQIQAGFIGLGNMGGKIAQNILRAAGALRIFDLDRARVDALCAQGGTAASSVAELAAACNVIFLSLPGPAQVNEVVSGPEGLLDHGREGQMLIDLSTVNPDTSRTLAEMAQQRGILYVDIPVSGGIANAEAGNLTLMAGGTEEELSAVMPLLEAIGKTRHYIGKRGGGSAIKIVNNFMAFCIQFINAEAMLITEHLDIPFDTFFDVVSNSTGGNFMLRQKAQKLKNDDIEPGFTIDLTIKDLELAVQMCRECGISNFTLNLVLQFYRMAQQRGYGAKDSSCVARMLRELEPKRE